MQLLRLLYDSHIDVSYTNNKLFSEQKQGYPCFIVTEFVKSIMAIVESNLSGAW